MLEQGAAAAMLAAAPPAATARRADRPNLVVIVVDTLRADHVYGDRARTPNMDALARGGVRFVDTHPEAMPTIPARNSLLQGRRQFPFRGWRDYPGLIDEPGWEPLDRLSTSLTTTLHRAGYWTAYATDNPFIGFSSPYERFRATFDAFARRGGQVRGRATGVSERELRHWLHPSIENGKSRDRLKRYLSNGAYQHDETRSFAARVFGDGVALLEQGAARRPFALVLDTFQAHEPWTPPRRYLDLYGDPDYRGREPSYPYYAQARSYLRGYDRRRLLARMRALYAAEVTLTDRWLGVFLDRLGELRLDRETAVVLVGDHGYLLGEHGYTGKLGAQLHPALTRVPLTIVHPEGRRGGRVSRFPASTHDIAPTILSLVGVRAPRSMTGADLSPVFGGRRPPRRRYAYGGYANNFYVRTGRWTLIGDNRGRRLRLYDPRADPGERRDVAGAHPAKARELYAAVLRRAGGRLPSYPER